MDTPHAQAVHWIEQALDLCTTKNLMIPLSQVCLLDIETPFADIITEVCATRHARYPVYHGKIDNIIGILHSKDLLKLLFSQRIPTVFPESALHEALFVSENKPVTSLLRLFQRKKRHFAIVVNEFGVTLGIVTIQDILEYLTGDMDDEFDAEAPASSDPNLITPDVTLEEFNVRFGTHLQSEEMLTIGGYLMELAHRLPKEGEEFSLPDTQLRISVTKVLGSKVKQLYIQALTD